jgi:ADP-ribosylglycohydrolase
MSKLPIDKYLGCILGGAIRDSLGAPTEFMSLQQIIEKYGKGGVIDYVEFQDEIGRITDDTQMTIFTAEGLLRAFHRAHLRGIWGAYLQITYSSYLRWLFTQGSSYTQKLENSFDKNGWILANKKLFSQRAAGNTCLSALNSGICGTIVQPINDSKGCGGIMRVAPVGLLFHQDVNDAFRIGAELAAITHGHPSGYLSAGAFASIISLINQGKKLQTAISDTIRILVEWENHEETLRSIRNAIDLFETSQPTFKNVEKLGGGWVGEEALSIALYCALHYQNDFEKAIILSINHSGDTDSTGSIVGNIVGLINGKKAIPTRWLENLELNDFLSELTEDLHTEVIGGEYDYNEGWAEKYPPC